MEEGITNPSNLSELLTQSAPVRRSVDRVQLSVIFDASSRVRAQQCSCVDIVRLTLHHVCCH